jgi:hypothetical protein
MELNRGACQTRHGVDDVVTVLLDRGVDMVGEVGVLVRQPGLGDLAGCRRARCQSPLAT